jgi:hypothetical protein
VIRSTHDNIAGATTKNERRFLAARRQSETAVIDKHSPNALRNRATVGKSMKTTGESERDMLFPRFTIRAILAIMAVCAVLFLLVGTAYRGQTWAWAATIGVFSLAVTALVHAACFGIVWCFAQMPSAQRPAAPSDNLAPARQEEAT